MGVSCFICIDTAYLESPELLLHCSCKPIAFQKRGQCAQVVLGIEMISHHAWEHGVVVEVHIRVSSYDASVAIPVAPVRALEGVYFACKLQSFICFGRLAHDAFTG